MRGMLTRMPRRLRTRTHAGFAVLAMALSVLAGSATGGKGEAPGGQEPPAVPAPYIDIAISYQRIGKPERAEEHLQTALTLVPGHPVACNEYGLLYRKTGRFAEARAIYEKAIGRFTA